jgi:D-alanyl-D-alanine carboxypeptidase
LERKEELNKAFDIPIAERKYLEKSNLKLNKSTITILTVLLLLFSIIGMRLTRDYKLSSIENNNIQNANTHDHSLFGHLPYDQISKEKLVVIEPNIEVHIDMKESLLKMRKDAKNDGIFLVFLSGYRSINLQEKIFYSLKSIRNQVASERARVSAPPGYSEHSTGFAIDIGDFNNPETDFEVEFEKTDAFKWLKNNAAKYHFKLSFNKNNKSVDYEPWHWRYEGSIEALKVFETSNRKSINTKN